MKYMYTSSGTQRINSRPIVYFSDEHNNEAIIHSHLKLIKTKRNAH